MKVRTKHLIDSFKGEPMPCLLRTIMALEAQQAELNRKLSAARRAMKQKLKEGKRDNQPKAGPEAGRGPGKPGGSQVQVLAEDGSLARGGGSVG